MHEYYVKNAPRIKNAMNGFLKLITSELEQHSGKSYAILFQEIWDHYEKNMLGHFPYIGGDTVSGTKNLTGAYCFVSMGEVLKLYGVSLEEIGHLMVLAYERKFNSMPRIVKAIAHKSFTNVKSLNRKYQKKDAQNAANAAKYPGSFETKTMIPPEEGYESFLHDLAVLEEETTLSFMKLLKNQGVQIKDFSEKELHLLTTTNIGAVFQTVEHDFTREEALHYADTLDHFFSKAWGEFFGY